MLSRVIYKIPLGMHIDQVCKRAALLSRLWEMNVQFYFNGIHLVAWRQHYWQDVKAAYCKEFTELRGEYDEHDVPEVTK